jgi:DNA modification methylase
MTPPNYSPNALPRNQILVGDACTRLAELPDASVDCVVTSPPYFALRDYGEIGQLGLEPTVDDWVRSLVKVGVEIRRVLKPTGSFWLNVADSYSHHPGRGRQKRACSWAHNGWRWHSWPTAGSCATMSFGPKQIRCRPTSRTG